MNLQQSCDRRETKNAPTPGYERIVIVDGHLAAGLTTGVRGIVVERSTAARLASSLRRLVRDDSGIAVTEYGLLIALIAVLLIGVVTIFGSSISSWFSAKTSTITTF